MSGGNVTGMTGGKAGTVFAAHTINGGAGNTVAPNNGGRSVSQSTNGSQDAVSLAGVEARDINIHHRSGEGQQQRRDVKGVYDYTVSDISSLLRSQKFTEKTVQCFEEHGIDGKYFVELTDDKVLEELGVTSNLQKMKLKTLVKEFTK